MTTGYVFDFDGTVSRAELLPKLAKEVGLAEEIATLTKATIGGLLDFRQSFKLRCRLLAEIPLSRVREILREIPLDPDIVAFIRARRNQCAVMTGNLECWVGDIIREALGCRLISSIAQTHGDRLGALTHIVSKGDALDALRQETGWSKIITVGEGANDVDMMRRSDIAIAFGGVHYPSPGACESSNYLVFQGSALCRLISQL
jgi:HAD superfamily phosphoserine phosphatase-like hydrolase